MPSTNVDHLARTLAMWGQRAAMLPRGSFEAEGQAQPLVDSRGVKIGTMVPGHGLAIEADLKKLGITKPVPYVIERSPWARVLEKLADDRGAITGLADLLALPRQVYVKNETVHIGGAVGVSQYFDNVASGTNFAAVTGSGAALTRTNFAGAYNARLADPPSGLKKYLLAMSMFVPSIDGLGFIGAIYLDILVAIGGIDATLTTLQTINSVALTRCTNGVGVLFALCDAGNALLAITSSVVTVTYTNQANTGSKQSLFQIDGCYAGCLTNYFVTTNQFCTFHTLATGDFGLRSIQSLQQTVGSTTVGGKYGILIFKPLYYIHAIDSAPIVVERDMRAEPECLIDFPLDSSGVQGYHSMFLMNSTATAATTQAVLSGIACDG